MVSLLVPSKKYHIRGMADQTSALQNPKQLLFTELTGSKDRVKEMFQN